MKAFICLCLFMLLSTPVFAQGATACIPTTQIAEYMKENYKEVPIIIGRSTRFNVVMVIYAGKGGRYTVVFNRENGTSCFIDAGQYLSILEDAKERMQAPGPAL